MARTVELNLDGLVGPTHNYAGLAAGNLAAQRWKHSASNPRAAALQGLAKMKFLADLGVPQAVLPPHERPDLSMLRQLGFGGSDAQVIEAAGRSDPVLLAACYSASSMWAANAATVSPGADTADGRVHFTPANLVSHFHRSLEAKATGKALSTILADDTCFQHHEPLPAGQIFSDEGAANHMRICGRDGAAGLEVFVYGRKAFGVDVLPRIHPARQTIEASQAVARLHGLDRLRTLFLKQSPAAIDAGVFHNDVAAVANENVLLYHKRAFDDGGAAELIGNAAARIVGAAPILIGVEEEQIPLEEAVRSYLFNSQIVTLKNEDMAMICPAECQELARTREFLHRLLEMGTPIRAVHFVDVRQSMQNGGGPACLRLRVVLSEKEMSRINQATVLTQELYIKLTAWITSRYRERLESADLEDPKLLEESRRALDELSEILGLGNFYEFQRP